MRDPWRCFVIAPEGTVHVTLNPIEGWAAAQKEKKRKHGKYLAMTLWAVVPFDRDCKTLSWLLAGMCWDCMRRGQVGGQREQLSTCNICF